MRQIFSDQTTTAQLPTLVLQKLKGISEFEPTLDLGFVRVGFAGESAILPLSEASRFHAAEDANGVILPLWCRDWFGPDGSDSVVDLDCITGVLSPCLPTTSTDVPEEKPQPASHISIVKVSSNIYFPTSQGLATGSDTEYSSWIYDLKRAISNVQLKGGLFAATADSTVVFRVADIRPAVASPNAIYIVNETTELCVLSASIDSAAAVIEPTGYESQLRDLKELIESSLFKRDLYAYLGIVPSNTVLVSGPSGVGKSHLISTVLYNHVKVPSFTVNVFELAHFLRKMDKNGTPVDKETVCPLRKAIIRAKCASPALIVIEGLDLLCNEPSGLDLDYSSCITRITSELSADKNTICVVATVQQPEKLPAVFKKRGQNGIFNSEIVLEVPSRLMRESIAKSMLRGINIDVTDKGLDDQKGEIAEKCAFRIAQVPIYEVIFIKCLSLLTFASQMKATPGFVARDINNLITRAALNAKLRHANQPPVDALTQQLSEIGMNDSRKSLHNPPISWSRDFSKVLGYISASQASDIGFDMSKADLRWDDIGGYDTVKSKLKSLIIIPLENPQSYDRLGVKPPSGILLYGPSGCGKSLLARTLGANCPLNFISVNGSKIFSKYLGESEATIRRIFELARKVAPCIIFFDEIDILGTRREWSEDGASGVNERVLSTLLNEMDGVAEQKGVIVIGATNRPEKLDDALLRPGRLDHHIQIPMPSNQDRKSILDTILKSGVNSHVDTARVAAVTEGFTSSDLNVLIREAKYLLLREIELIGSEAADSLEWKHVAAALSGALKGDLKEVFQKAFEIVDEKEEEDDETNEKVRAFWKSFGGDIEGTWGVSAFQQSVAEAAEMNAVLACRIGGGNPGGADGAWWRPGSVTEEDAVKFVKFAKGSKK
ncbi:UNVERIFIED_CONTAM: hypothetical protein HDU68_004989, partial [Siphonaria sp. JEL0065]